MYTDISVSIILTIVENFDFFTEAITVFVLILVIASKTNDLLIKQTKNHGIDIFVII